MSDFKAKTHQIRFPPLTPLGELPALLGPPAQPIPALGPPVFETTCLPKYGSLNPPMGLLNSPSLVILYKIKEHIVPKFASVSAKEVMFYLVLVFLSVYISVNNFT